MKSAHFWTILAIINLALGLFLWFLLSTDYSLVGTIPDIISPLFVLELATASLFLAITRNKLSKLLITTLLPSLLGGGLSVLAGILLFIPPFTLGGMFALGEAISEIQIQKSVSPNGKQIAYVYFRNVGAYSSAHGRVLVRVRSSNLPFLERDIFGLSRSDADENPTNYLEWRDDNTIYISEIKKEIPLGTIEIEVPQIFKIPYGIIQIFLSIAEEAEINQKQTIPIKDIPMYKGNVIKGRIVDDESHFENWKGIEGEEEYNIWRRFDIERGDLDKVIGWYKIALNTAPWKLIKVNQYTETYPSGNTVNIYCIQASRNLNGENQLFYWDFEALSNPSWSDGVHIDVGTPQPASTRCEKNTTQ